MNSLADHASEVSEPIQAIHLLLEGVNKARDVEDTGEAIVERLLGAAYCPRKHQRRRRPLKMMRLRVVK